MNKRRLLQSSWLLILVALFLGTLVAPSAVNNAHAQQQATTPLQATVYLPTANLYPLFQTTIDQQVPTVVNGTVKSVVGSLPAKDQDWAQLMAKAILQPSASLVSITPQQGGMVANLRVTMYHGDPKPINAQTLVTFGVRDAATVQVSGQPLPGSPALVNGPLTTLQVPFGQLNSINATNACGDTGLEVGLTVPLALGTGKATGLVNPFTSNGHIGAAYTTAHTSLSVPSASQIGAYVELPASQIAKLGKGIGTLPINGSLSAQNIQVSVVGSKFQITADISLGGAITLGKATSTAIPTATNGNLGMQIQQTQMTVFQIFSFPYNTYNQQIQQTLNSQLNSALAGQFNVQQAAIGPNSHIPCAASNSLILTGTTSLG